MSPKYPRSPTFARKQSAGWWGGWVWVCLPAHRWLLEPSDHLCSWYSQPSSHRCSSFGRIPCPTLLIVCMCVLQVSTAAPGLQECGVLAGEGLIQDTASVWCPMRKTRKASLLGLKTIFFCIKKGWQLKELMGQCLCRRWWRRRELLSPSLLECLPLLSDIASR